MEEIIPRLPRRDKRRLHRNAQKCRDARLRTRYLIILNLDDGITPSETAERLHVSRNTVYRVARRFREEGEAGLVDRREENGKKKLDDDYLGLLYELVESSPLKYGWRRPTWTREMFVKTIFQETGIYIHVSTMSRAPQGDWGSPWSPEADGRVSVVEAGEKPAVAGDSSAVGEPPCG